MTETDTLYLSARRHHEAGRSDVAKEIYRQIITINPCHAGALQMLGVLAHKSGETSAALELLKRAESEDPKNPALLINLGVVTREMGDTAAAKVFLLKALALDPKQSMGHFNLGNLYRETGHFLAALDSYEEALSLSRDDPNLLHNKGVTLRELGRVEAAARVFSEVIRLAPKHAGALNNLGVIFLEQGEPETALRILRQAEKLTPSSAETLNNLGLALVETRNVIEAGKKLEEAARLEPSNKQILKNIGSLDAKVGNIPAAQATWRRALEFGNDDGLLFRLSTLLPVVASSLEEMNAARRELDDSLQEMARLDCNLVDPYVEVGASNFLISYHDTNNKDTQKHLAALYIKACPGLGKAHCEKRHEYSRVRVGFISRQLQLNSVGRCFHGIMRFMPREDIHVTAFTFSKGSDPLWSAIAEDVDQAIILPSRLGAARKKIAKTGLDVLIYTDIGMEPLTYFLSFARLAPVQCVLGGHPDTVGVPNIDYYLSSELQEPIDADTHYAECLVRLPGAPTYYDRPELPKNLKSRAEFGLPQNGSLYFCGQTLFKIHPAMDNWLGEILRADPKGYILIPAGFTPGLSDRLQARFERSIPDVVDRVQFLPAMSHMNFMNVLSLSDVSLDTRPFGGGNTSWQAIAAGTPMVTWPGRFLRGRYTAALYQLMNIEEPVVYSGEEYVSRAVQFAKDCDFQRHVLERVAERSDSIFGDMCHVNALSEFILRVARD